MLVIQIILSKFNWLILKRDLFTAEENVIIVKMMGAKNIFHALLRKYIFLLML
jgi:hypothetical protein